MNKKMDIYKKQGITFADCVILFELHFHNIPHSTKVAIFSRYPTDLCKVHLGQKQYNQTSMMNNL